MGHWSTLTTKCPLLFENHLHSPSNSVKRIVLVFAKIFIGDLSFFITQDIFKLKTCVFSGWTIPLNGNILEFLLMIFDLFSQS